MDDLPNLIFRAQKGDKEAYGAIYSLYYKQIYRYCYFNLRDSVLAQDIVQETFLKAWKALSSFSQDGGGTIQAFLYRIARNLIIDHSRRRKNAKLEDHEYIEAESQIEDEIDKNSEKEKLNEALGQLAERDRQIVILRFFEEMPFTEISKVVKVREGALRVRVHRILEKLKTILENDGR